jgi:hypothetical protein
VRPGEDATWRGEEDAVRVAELRSAPLAPQGDELGAQHHDLRGPGSAGTGTAASLEDATHQHVDDRHDQDLRTVDEAQTLETRLPPSVVATGPDAAARAELGAAAPKTPSSTT